MKNRCRHPPWRKRSTKGIIRKQNRPTTQPNSTSPYKPKQWLWMHSNSGREMARLLHVSLAMWIAAAEQNRGRAAGRRSEKRAESAAALSKNPLPRTFAAYILQSSKGRQQQYAEARPLRQLFPNVHGFCHRHRFITAGNIEYKSGLRRPPLKGLAVGEEVEKS